VQTQTLIGRGWREVRFSTSFAAVDEFRVIIKFTYYCRLPA
jgi:hypothetical protein